MLRDILPNPAPGTDSHPRVADISSDGSTVVGNYGSVDGDRLFQWRIDGSVTILLDNVGQPLQGQVVAVSNDGKKILGSRIYGTPYSTPFIWTEGLGVQDLSWNSGQLK